MTYSRTTNKIHLIDGTHISTAHSHKMIGMYDKSHENARWNVQNGTQQEKITTFDTHGADDKAPQTKSTIQKMVMRSSFNYNI